MTANEIKRDGNGQILFDSLAGACCVKYCCMNRQKNKNWVAKCDYHQIGYYFLASRSLHHLCSLGMNDIYADQVISLITKSKRSRFSYGKDCKKETQLSQLFRIHQKCCTNGYFDQISCKIQTFLETFLKQFQLRSFQDHNNFLNICNINFKYFNETSV